MYSRSLLAHLSLILSLVTEILAQKPKAECLSGWEWNRNSLDQDPCAVGMNLDASCRGVVDYPYAKVEKYQYYIPPKKNTTGDLDCDCNSVMYSLRMACATCQEGISYAWSKWTVDCEGVYIAQLPYELPQGTAVPRWAYYNVTMLKDQKYDDYIAKNIGRDPEEMPKPSSTGVVNNRNQSSKTPAIVGGVVGGAGALIIIPIVAYYVFQRIRRNRNENLQSEYQETPIDHWKIPPSFGSNFPSQLYNPDDPRTFPPPISTGQTHQHPAQPSVTFATPPSRRRSTLS